MIFLKNKIKINKDIFKKYKMFFYILAVSLVVLVFLVFLIKKNSEDFSENYYSSDKQDSLNAVCDSSCQTRLIDGEVVAPGEEAPFLISAVLDNQTEARPQFGLSKASLVYDIPAEGGINRFLAIFRSDLPDNFKIGPVRSARPYFLDIAKEYESLMIHCGGSPEALVKISKEKLLTLNEFYNSYYFSRYQNYSAPHNVLADYQKLKEYLKDKDLNNSNFVSWKFKTKTNFNSDSSKTNSEIDIQNGQYQYDINWNYNLENNNYSKKIGHKDHLDDSGEVIVVDNIVLQFVDTKILDDALRLKIDLLGQGRAIICLDGFCQNGYYKKENNNIRTVYYYDNGEEVVFNIGKTWIHLIDERTSVDIKNFTL